MKQRNLSVDALYEMTMQRNGDLRCDAAHGRDYRRSAVDSRDRAVEPDVTTSSTICAAHPEPSH